MSTGFCGAICPRLPLSRPARSWMAGYSRMNDSLLPTPTPDPSPCLGTDPHCVDAWQGEGMGFLGGGGCQGTPHLPDPPPPSPQDSSELWTGTLRRGGKGGEGETDSCEDRPSAGAIVGRANGNDRRPRLAIVGVGRAGQADDGAGPALCAALQKLGGSHPDRLVVDAGPAPENVTGLLRRFRPDVVVLVDAAAMSERPGAVRWLERGCALGCSASTHTLPLGMLATYLRESLGCDVRLLGIQPAVIGEEGPLSAPVCRTVERLARRLTMVKERSG